MKFIFGMQINIEVFYKLMISFGNQLCPKYPKVCISLQNIQKHFGDKVDFFPADKHESFVQDNSIFSGVDSQACPNYTKQHICNTLQNHKENIQTKLIFIFRLCKILSYQVGVVRHAQITQNNRFIFLSNILRKI